MDPRATVVKLLAQATDGAVEKEEARSFAHKAAVLIVQHKLLGEIDRRDWRARIANAVDKLPPVEKMIEHAGGIALGASAIEILQLKERVRQLEGENDRLRQKLRRRRRIAI